MFSIKSLRTKSILAALIPTVLVLVVVAAIVFYVYEQPVRDVVQQRDAELARISAARLSEGLSQYSRVLQGVAAGDDVQSMEPARLRSALEKAQHQLYVFGAGVVVYDDEGLALWSQPFANERQGTNFPIPSKFDTGRRTLRPVFSDVFEDTLSGEAVILVGVPIVDRGGEFKGVLAGMFKMKHPLLGPIYAEVLELKVGRSGYAYLVDGNGRVIYHPDGSQMGQNLATTVPVIRATRGETGAIFTEDSTGERIISGFAPVPGTDWKLITQQRWQEVIGPIRGYTNLLLGLLVMGGFLSSAAIFFALGRVLGPIQNLIQGARRIAAGDFDYTIAAQTGDEIEALARQFNTMAGALKESFAELEQRLAERIQAEAALRESETRYRALFEDSPVSLWEEDFSAVKRYLSSLRDSGITDIRAYFKHHPEALGRCAAMVEVVDVNRATLEMLQFENKEALLGNLGQIFREESYDVFHEELITLTEGKTAFEAEAVNQTLHGDEIYVSLRLTIVPGYEETWSKVFVSFTDITKRVRVEEALRRYTEQLETLRQASLRLTSILALQPVLDAVLEYALQLIAADDAHIFLYDGQRLTFGAARWAGEREEEPYAEPRPDGLTYTVARSGERIVISDVNNASLYQDWPWGGSIVGLPLRSGDQVHGVMNVAFTRPHVFDESELRILALLADQAAVAIDNARLHEQVQRHAGELEARIAAATREISQRAAELAVLYEVGKEITSTLELDAMLQTIADDAVRLVGADKSLILLIDAEQQRLTRAVGYGYSQVQLKKQTFEEFQQGLSGWVLREKIPTRSADIQADERNRGKALASACASGDRAAAVAPLLIGDEVIGTLTVVNSKQERATFTPADLNLVTMLAGQAAIAIQNAQLYEAAQEADRLKSAFLAAMSHELRTPLNSIIGFTGILLQGLVGPLNDEQTKQLGMVRDSAHHLLDLINDVLDISKIEAGQLEIASERLDVGEVIEKVVRTVTPLAEKKGLRLVAQVTPEVGQITSDRRRVEQILINLVNNAIKFTEKGEIRVQCQVSDEWLVTRVIDTGTGIKPEDIDTLFEPFRQIDTGLARRHEGTGLGLSICKKLVEMLGGEISVESKWGVGSTFTFTLPRGKM